jgi:hypothetical protein
MTDFKDFKPGVIYEAGKPEYIGRFPVCSETVPIARYNGPTPTDLEMAEHGSLALRIFAAGDDPRDPRDNRVTADYTLTVGDSVLVRGKSGWFMTTLERNRKGWFVRVGEKPNRHHLAVTLDVKRGCYVVREAV